MRPSKNCGRLSQVALRVAAGFLVCGDIWLLKISARAHQQKLECIFGTAAPIKLRRGPRPLSKIIKCPRLWRIEVSPGSKSIHKTVITQLAFLSAVVRVEIVVIDRRSTKIHIPVAAQVGARTRGNVHTTTEKISIFRR